MDIGNIMFFIEKVQGKHPLLIDRYISITIQGGSWWIILRVAAIHLLEQASAVML